jgi:hypothetical protein
VAENEFYNLECVVIALLAGSYLVALVVRRLSRRRPGLGLAKPVMVAFLVRIVAAAAIGTTSFSGQLRGGDEVLFQTKARALTGWDLMSTGTLDALTHQLHVVFLSLSYRIFDQVPDLMFRIEVISIAVAGVAFMAAAVYELAGARAARIAAWFLALEPANIFFSGILHKEPFMLLAEGLVAYGGAVLWKRGRLSALVPMITGCLIATATRPYAGWFLAAAAAALTLHASIRHKRQGRSIVLAVVVVGLAVAFFPTVWNASSNKNLSELQASQDANASNTSANLSLERVDYSTRGKVIVNLPQRMLDVITKPYPWQVGNISQQLGVLGTLTLWTLLFLVARTLARNKGPLLRRAGPLLYAIFFLLVAYSLSAGNAGTAFRYRTHLVALTIAVFCVLRWAHAEAPAEARLRPRRQPQPILARSQMT